MNYNAAQFHPTDCGGLDNECPECIVEDLEKRLQAAEDELEAWRTGDPPCCEEVADTGGHHDQCHGWPAKSS
jgi:hypothetical protein